MEPSDLLNDLKKGSDDVLVRKVLDELVAKEIVDEMYNMGARVAQSKAPGRVQNILKEYTDMDVARFLGFIRKLSGALFQQGRKEVLDDPKHVQDSPDTKKHVATGETAPVKMRLTGSPRR